MEPIDGLEKLMRLMRSTAAEKSIRPERRTDARQSAASGHGAAATRLTVEQELRAKVRQLKQTSASSTTVGQAVIGTILAREFSDQLYNETKFNALVQQVHRHVENEPELNAAFLRMLEHLSQ